MDASEYKNYLLGLIFYKYLSDAQLREVYEQENGKTDTFPERSTQYAGFMEWYEEDKDDLIENIQPKQGYFIQPDQLFYHYRREVYEQENGKTDTFPERSTQYAGFMEWYEEDKDDLIENIQPKQGYFIQPDQLFYHYRIKADNYEFNLTDLQAGKLITMNLT